MNELIRHVGGVGHDKTSAAIIDVRQVEYWAAAFVILFVSVRLKITWAQASPQSLAGCRQLRHGARNGIDAGG